MTAGEGRFRDGPCTLTEADEDDEQRSRPVTAPTAAQEPDPAPTATPDVERRTDTQDGRTTAEWIADLVKARQAAEAETERLRAIVARVEALADDLAAEVEEMRAEIPPVGASGVAHLYRTVGLSDAKGRLSVALADPEPAQVQQAEEAHDCATCPDCVHGDDCCRDRQ